MGKTPIYIIGGGNTTWVEIQKGLLHQMLDLFLFVSIPRCLNINLATKVYTSFGLGSKTRIFLRHLLSCSNCCTCTLCASGSLPSSNSSLEQFIFL